MPEPVVSASAPVTLAGGSDIATIDLNISLKLAPVLVAADGGANVLAAAGLTPEAVIGDLDSIDDAARSRFDTVLHYIDEPDTTDFEKALARIVAPLIVAVGFWGARIDHSLSVLNVLARHQGAPVVLLGPDDVAFLAPADMTLALPVGTRMSLMPLAKAGMTSQGLRWDLNGAALSPVGLTSPSNETASPHVRVQVQGPVLAVLPREHLAAAIDVVRGQ